VTRREAILNQLAVFEPEDWEPVQVTIADLGKLQAEDLEPGIVVEPIEGVVDGVTHLSSNMTLRRPDGRLVADFEEIGWRKFWTGVLGIEEHFGLLRDACVARARSHGDITLGDEVDEGVVYGFHFTLDLPTENLREAFDAAVDVRDELLEPILAIHTAAADLVARTSRRLAGWGDAPLDQMVDAMRSGTSAEKGRRLEELLSRLFQTVPGFTATGHVLTETEEIDVRILNESDDPHWRDERHLLLAECKNWSSSCGKNEIVLFRQKMENRVGRVSCGFLISWNGFAQTVTKEMLRGSQGDLLVVPISGQTSAPPCETETSLLD